MDGNNTIPATADVCAAPLARDHPLHKSTERCQSFVFFKECAYVQYRKQHFSFCWSC